MADLRLQNFVIARLSEFCDFRSPLDPERVPDPIGYLWAKLQEVDRPIYELKQQLLQDAVGSFFKKAEAGELGANGLPDFKQLLDSYLAPGDFADAAFMLDEAAMKDSGRRRQARDFLRGVKAHCLLDEESKPEAKRNKNWKRIVADIYLRLEYPLIEKVLSHKKLNARRLQFILRRCRLNSAEFCTVFHFPKSAEDTFTPFILPRVEALIAADRRILERIRCH